MPYAFSRTISDVLCTFKRFHNFIFHQSARWVYLGPGVKVGSLFWSARMMITVLHRDAKHRGEGHNDHRSRPDV